jgi:hypothetical protein
MARLRSHGRQITQVDADQPPTDLPKRKSRPIEPEVDAFDHRIGGSDHKPPFRLPDGGIVVLTSADQ